LHSVHIIRHDEVVVKPLDIQIRKDEHLLLSGPNGIGKSTLLQKIVSGEEDGCTLGKDVRIGYYRQDFSNLDFNQTVYDCLRETATDKTEQELRSIAAGFLIT
jgi:ATPase subunit of ABC transporter with duplicated ATPase domains